ncbi:ABC transporter ATP-binding protein [Chengkuizengella sediminis]|uniref:ABC transporter ATP-binding protein n=1 Tax=Chengkuizengella sediminis TaxID=1885917 RepID=UPI0013899BE5|nr:ABC transporter ATP-binding protein [Chengkuizengella sediminis]NDI34927.1 ABC transporter ATP-binding protein [Chengkuizengella sediminis]
MNITIKNINKSYQGKKAISDVNITLSQNSFTAIVGPSGCGKTTLLRCLAGFLDPDEGNILFGDQDVTKLSSQKRGTGMVFQNYALWPHMSVFDNIAYGLKLNKTPKKEREKKVYKILEKVEIDATDVKKRHPQQYSGGQQQRIALARALVLEPKLLLMDEPLSNLDAKVRQRLRIEIRRLQKDLGITAVYVTHDQEEAFTMADQVVLMNKGNVVQAGSPEELYAKPASYFSAHFLGNSNTLEIKYKNGSYYLGDQKLDFENKKETPGSNGYHLVIRSEEAFLSFDGEQYSDCVTLKGELVESLFTGSSYRNLVELEGQSLFIDTEEKLSKKGNCNIVLPKDKCFMFPSSE